MNPDDPIYSPIFPEEELKDLVRRIMPRPSNEATIEEISSDIVDLFKKHDITDQETIIDTVYRKMKEINQLLATTSRPWNPAPACFGGEQSLQIAGQCHRPVITPIPSLCQTPWS